MGEQSSLQYQLPQTNLINETTIPPFAIQCSISNMNSFPTLSPKQRKLLCMNNSFIYGPSINQSMTYCFPPINNGYAPQQKEQVLHKQWKTNDVSQILENNRYQTPKHIVSPEAIREAQKEEMDWPFSNFSTLFALKQQGSSLANIHPKVNHRILSTEQEDLMNNVNSFFSLNHDRNQTASQINPKVSENITQKDFSQEQTSFVENNYLSSQATQNADPKSKRRYSSDDDEFENTNSEKSFESLAKNTSSCQSVLVSKKRTRKSNLPQGQKDPRGRKKKISKHPYAPKHPMSAYLHYLIDVYPKVSLNFPGSTVGPISKSISATWHAMTVEEKTPWQQKAQLDKARYAQELKIYMEKNESEQVKVNQ
ncbi:unnamed protein product [Rhizopus stolonifer]